MWFNMANTCWVTGILFLCYLANFGQATQPVAKIRLWLKFKAMLKSKAGQEPMKFVLEVEEGKLKLYAIESEIAQLCPTLCDPVDCSLPGSSVNGIFQARVLEWVAVSFSKGSSLPRDWTWVSALKADAYRLRHFWWGNESTEELGNLLSNCWLSEKQRLDWNEVTWLHSMDSLLPMFPLKKLTEPPGQWLCCPFNFPSDWIH